MTKSVRFTLICTLAVTLLTQSTAHAEPLNVAPGSDPGGTAVGVITAPFSLSPAAISQKLARDGEGVAIGWDFSKAPETPESGVHAESDGHNVNLPTVPEVVTALTGPDSPTRLVTTFVDRSQPNTWAQAVAFIARTPARIVVVPFATDTETDWAAFRAAAQHFPNLLFIVPAEIADSARTNETETGATLSYPAKFHLSNVLSVSLLPTTQGDIRIAGSSASLINSPNVALAVTLKTLLMCSSQHAFALPATSKLEAMAKLATLNAPQTIQDQQSETPAQSQRPFTPCTEALN